MLRAAAAEIDPDAWREIIKSEWVTTVVAEGRGGQGLGAFDIALALEQAGRQLLMVPLLEAAAAALTLSRATDSARAGTGLADLLRGSRLTVPATAAAAWRYDGGTSNIQYDHKTGVLYGSIAFVAYGRSAEAFLVAIDSGTPPVVAVVPRGDAAVEQIARADLIRPGVGEGRLRALDLGRLALDLGGRVWDLEANEHVTLAHAVALPVRHLGDPPGFRRDHDELRAGRRRDDARGMHHATDGSSCRRHHLHGDDRFGLDFFGRLLAAPRGRCQHHHDNSQSPTSNSQGESLRRDSLGNWKLGVGS
jgi:hypothetical protein